MCRWGDVGCGLPPTLTMTAEREKQRDDDRENDSDVRDPVVAEHEPRRLRPATARKAGAESQGVAKDRSHDIDLGRGGQG
jgi:hypothetical protein